MTLVFVTNYINHHQVHVADEFYKILGDNYTFISTIEMYEFRKQLGYPDFSDRPYLMKAYMSEEMRLKSLQLAYDADVVIIGSASEEYVTERIKASKLTFRYNERWFKSKPWYLSGPMAWLNFYKNHIRFRHKPLYMLAASAYTANDVYAIGAYKDKVYKWGYFTKVEEFDIESTLAAKRNNKLKLMWCARFLDWKHPELPVLLAKRLREDGFHFDINMYGSGVESEKIKKMISNLNLGDIVHLKGNLPNDEMLMTMRQHHIFLFTSDKEEGWGTVLNESMSSGCAVVASNRIGATPFLIKVGVNGLVFNSEDINSLYHQVRKVMSDEVYRESLARNAYLTMFDEWNPKVAACRFLSLVDELKKGGDTAFYDGPISKSIPCN